MEDRIGRIKSRNLCKYLIVIEGNPNISVLRIFEDHRNMLHLVQKSLTRTYKKCYLQRE